MAVHGLDGVDLESAARLAIAGLSNTPDRDIAAWLRSGQPLEQRTRDALADAFEGISATKTVIKVTSRKSMSKLRAIRKRVDHHKIGRAADKMIESMGWTGAVEHFSKRAVDRKARSAKSVEAYITDARVVDRWIMNARIQHITKCREFSDREFEFAFIYAEISKEDPIDVIGSFLTALAAAIYAADKMEKSARGIALP